MMDLFTMIQTQNYDYLTRAISQRSNVIQLKQLNRY